jgi:hypothetical protein
MIDPQAPGTRLLSEAINKLVIMSNTCIVLDVQANQSVYGKKAAVVDAPVGFLPVAQPVHLFAGKCLQLFRIAIDSRSRLFSTKARVGSFFISEANCWRHSSKPSLYASGSFPVLYVLNLLQQFFYSRIGFLFVQPQNRFRTSAGVTGYMLS